MSAAIAGRSAPSDIPAPMPGGAHVRRRAPAWPRAVATALAALLLAASMALSHIFAVRLGLVLHPLDVPVMLQDPALPNGCEAVSLAAALDYAGVAADPLDLTYGYIPRRPFTEQGSTRWGPSPEEAYPGDPASGRGFYCFAAPLAQGANACLDAVGACARAHDITGVTFRGLREYLDQGTPVVVWVTTDYGPPRTGSFQWTVPATGKPVTALANAHCVVLTALGRTRCMVMDPLQSNLTLRTEEFLSCFEAMGSRALVVRPG